MILWEGNDVPMFVHSRMLEAPIKSTAFEGGGLVRSDFSNDLTALSHLLVWATAEATARIPVNCMKAKRIPYLDK